MATHVPSFLFGFLSFVSCFAFYYNDIYVGTVATQYTKNNIFLVWKIPNLEEKKTFKIVTNHIFVFSKDSKKVVFVTLNILNKIEAICACEM